MEDSVDMASMTVTCRIKTMDLWAGRFQCRFRFIDQLRGCLMGAMEYRLCENGRRRMVTSSPYLWIAVTATLQG